MNCNGKEKLAPCNVWQAAQPLVEQALEIQGVPVRNILSLPAEVQTSLLNHIKAANKYRNTPLLAHAVINHSLLEQLLRTSLARMLDEKADMSDTVLWAMQHTLREMNDTSASWEGSKHAERSRGSLLHVDITNLQMYDPKHLPMLSKLLVVVTHNWSQASDLELIWEFFENIWQTDASQKERLADLCERIHTRHLDLSELKQTSFKLKQ